MIINILIFILLVSKFHKNNEIIKFIFITYWLSLLVFGLKLLEFQFGRITYFISDESAYFYLVGDILANKERLAWALINQFLKNYDVLGAIGIKLLNIPIGILSIILLSKIFDNKIPYKKFLFYMPYLLILFTLDIRDILILLIVFKIILLTKKINIKNLIFIFFLLFILFFLRPLFVFLIIAIILSIRVLPIVFRRYTFRQGIKYIVPVVLILLLGYMLFKSQINSVVRRYSFAITYHYIDNNVTLFANRGDGGAYTGNIFQYFLFRGIPRFVLTPMPTSLVKRLLHGGDKQWGFTDDFVRCLNQFIYYYLLLFIIVNLKYLKNIIKEMTEIQLITVGFLFSYMPIYAFYLLGVSQQRLKIPFQIAVFIIYYLIVIYKKNKQLTLKNP